MKTYEERGAELAKHFANCLDNFKVGPSDDLSKISDRIQADLNLADYKFKVRQADHVHQLLYGPLAISFATLVLAAVVAFVSTYQSPQKELDTKASLVLKVLAAPPENGKKLLKFFKDAKLLKLEPAEEGDLEDLLNK